MITAGASLADVSTFIKQRRSLNLSKSVPKLINERDNNQTIREILVDFDRNAIKSIHLKAHLNGTETERQHVCIININYYRKLFICQNTKL